VENLPAALFMEWMEYERLEPFGSWRDNYHTAMLASILANAHRNSNRRPFGMAEFFYVDPETAMDKHDQELLMELRSRKKH
jgi:hypothetical protein